MFEQVARISGAVNTGALDKAFAHPFLSLLIRARHFTISIFTSEAVKFVLGTIFRKESPCGAVLFLQLSLVSKKLLKVQLVIL